MQFRGYRAIWRSQGVLPMLRRLLHDFKLPQTLIARSDGERVLTNLLHLSELLQQAASELDGEQALIPPPGRTPRAVGGRPVKNRSCAWKATSNWSRW
jgi:ATP-dependent exoDNAse (exonuclease V) beta subunit